MTVARDGRPRRWGRPSRGARLLAAVLWLMGCVGVAAVPGPTPGRPMDAMVADVGTAAGGARRVDTTTNERYLSAWLPYWTADLSYRSVARASGLFRSASPFAFSSTGTTALTSHPAVLTTAIVSGLHARGILVVPSVTTSLTAARIAAIGADPAARAAHVRALVALVAGKPYDGLDLDYEHQARTTSVVQARAVRASYDAIVADLCHRLHAIGKLCDVTVMPRTDDSFATWHGILIPAVYDYAALGESADRIRVMAYDEHNCFTGPGPVAPLPWVRSVIAYTLTQVPAAEVELGVPTYGYRWHGSTCRPVVWGQAGGGHWDAADAELTTGNAWYADARSIAARVSLAHDQHLAGVALWAPGMEDPTTWSELAGGA
jgi:spore germination protein